MMHAYFHLGKNEWKKTLIPDYMYYELVIKVNLNH